MKLAIILFLTILFFSNTVFATIRLNIGIIWKKGIDKNLVLVSELHSVENINGKENVTLEIKNGPIIILGANFAKASEEYGPSAFIKVQGEIYSHDEKHLRSVLDDGLIIKIGTKKTFSIQNDEDQLIEITIKPDIH